jgi:hypothetical protein
MMVMCLILLPVAVGVLLHYSIGFGGVLCIWLVGAIAIGWIIETDASDYTTHTYTRQGDVAGLESPDNRTDFDKVTNSLHVRPLTATVIYERKRFVCGKLDEEDYLRSEQQVHLELVAQLVNPSTVSQVGDDADLARSLTMAAKQAIRYNYDRFDNLSEDAAIMASIRLAYGIIKSQRERVAPLPFPVAPVRVIGEQ